VPVGNGQNMINKHIQRLRNAEDGFDLVQALVVVVILGALATIAVLTLLGQAQKGDRASVSGTISQGVNTAKRVQVDGGGTASAWRSGIAIRVQDEVRASLSSDTDRANFTATGAASATAPLVITYVRSGSGCRASMALDSSSGDGLINVSYSVPSQTPALSNGCP